MTLSACGSALGRAGGTGSPRWARQSADQRIPRCHVGGLARMDLVHGTAVGIEELQAVRGRPSSLGGLLGHGIAGMPLGKEQAQVDLAAQRQSRRRWPRASGTRPSSHAPWTHCA
jgi:hypothetical protein